MRRAVVRSFVGLSCLLCAFLTGMWLDSRHRTGFSEHSLLSIQTSLARQLPALRFDEVELADCFDFLRDVEGDFDAAPGKNDPQSQIRFSARPVPRMRQRCDELNVDWNRLSAVGVKPTTPRSINVANIAGGSAFTSLTNGLPIKVHAASHLIRVSTPDDIYRPNQVERLYLFPWRTRPEARDRFKRVLPESAELNESDSLSNFLKAISDGSGLPIRVDWTSFEPLGITPESTVDPGKAWATYDQALRTALANACPTGNAQFRIENGYIQLASREEFDSRDWPYRLANWLLVILAAQIALFTTFRWLKQGPGGKRKFKRAAQSAFCALVIGSLISGYFAPDPLEFTLFSNTLSISRAASKLRIQSLPSDPMTPYYEIAAGKRPNSLTTRQLANSRLLQIDLNDNSFDSWSAQLPLAMPFAMTLILPAMFVTIAIRRALRRRSLASQGRCRKCGYDLRATPDRCPECGFTNGHRTFVADR